MAAVETRTEVRAVAKYVRTAPRKAQLVAEQIRGLPVAQARTTLAFMTRAAARDVAKVLDSAVANAEANHDLSGDDLFVSAAYVGSGPTLKRWRARARGRVGRIRKRTCHITVELATLEGAVTRPPPPPAAESPAQPRRGKEQQPAPVEAGPEAEGPQAPRAEAAAGAEAAAEQAPAGEAPSGEPAAKPARARRKAATGEAPAAAAEAPEPKPARAPRKKREPTAGDEPSGERPPRAPRRRKASDDAGTSGEGGTS